jgi:hypothetical protein
VTGSELEEYGQRLENEVRGKADAESIPQYDAFASRTLDLLEEGGLVANHTVQWFQSPKGVTVHGYGHSDDDTILDLYTTSYDLQRSKLTKNELEKFFRQALAFLDKLATVKQSYDRGSSIHQLCEGVERVLQSPDGVDRIRVILLTNRESVARTMPEPPQRGATRVEYHLWDLAKLYRQETAGDLGEPISVTFDPPLRCLTTSNGQPHQVLLAVVPGHKLAELYDEHRTRLLQLNVRAYLQARGKVNKGIRDTAINDPAWFLAYNNGITATASKVDFTNDGTAVRELTGLQIVNGGQTTATLHHVFKRDKNDLTDIEVQMKLTIVEPEQLETVVPRISMYSNTQNRVSDVDFSSNDRFHVEFERVSRSVWAPAPAGELSQTRWFYIRTRGAYEAELDKNPTTAGKRTFRQLNPRGQVFAKTDLAKYVNAWASLPHLVSRGAQKNFVHFQEQVAKDAPVVDADYCRRVVALKILFDATDRAAREQKAGSNKSAITAYTMALLCHMTERRVDLDQIWREQRINPALQSAIDNLCARVMKVVVRDGVHVIEWAKKVECWREVCQIDWTVPQNLESELRTDPLSLGKADAAADEDRAARFREVTAEDWDALKDWGQETGLLDLHDVQTISTVLAGLESEVALAPAKVRDALDVRERGLAAGYSPAME